MGKGTFLLQSHEKRRELTSSPPSLTIYGPSGGLASGYIHPAKVDTRLLVCSGEQWFII